MDEFLQENETYKKRLKESHPEVCFARLNGAVLMSSKHTDEGMQDRADVLQRYLEGTSYEDIKAIATRLRCQMDDVTDAICLAIVANLDTMGKTETIPENPMKDETGLLMRMVVPKKNENCSRCEHILDRLY